MTDSGTWRQVLMLYGQTSLAFRLKFFIRWKHGNPFERFEPYVPSVGRIIDVGCGDGFFANFLSLRCAGREVTGVDIDARKIRMAQETVGTRTNIRFEVHDLMKESLPPCDTIVMIDVLHHMRFEEQDQILATCQKALSSDGMLFVLDNDVRPWWKYSYIFLFDCLTGLFDVTRGSALSYQGVDAMTGRLTHAGFHRIQAIPFARFDLAPRVLFRAEKTT